MFEADCSAVELDWLAELASLRRIPSARSFAIAALCLWVRLKGLSMGLIGGRIGLAGEIGFV